MQWDGEDSTRRARHRDAELRRYLRGDLGRFTPFYRDHLRECGVDPRQVRGLTDLARLRPVVWDDLASDPDAFVVQPSRRELVRHADRRLVLAVLLGTITRQLDRVNRTVVEPRYKPIVWVVERGESAPGRGGRRDDVPLGYTSSDLELLAEAGSRVLSVAGLERSDVLVGLTDAGPALAHWQLVLGARAAGLSAVHLGARAAPADVSAARPTVIAGPPDALLRALTAPEAVGLERLRAVVVAGTDPDPGTRDALETAAAALGDPPPAVLAMWAPPGARALWGECAGGGGFHTYPDLEIVEVGRGGGLHNSGAGELIWSALGWRGTAPFRLLTGARGEVVDRRCEACGRKGPMVVTGTAAAVTRLRPLRRHSDVTAFQVEVGQRNGSEEVVVYLALNRRADLLDVLDSIDEEIDAAQYVVLTQRQVEARVQAAAGARVVERRLEDR